MKTIRNLYSFIQRERSGSSEPSSGIGRAPAPAPSYVIDVVKHDEETPRFGFSRWRSPSYTKEISPVFQNTLACFVLEDYNKRHDTKFELEEFDATTTVFHIDGFGRHVCGYHLYLHTTCPNIFAEVFWCRETEEAKITFCDIVDPNDQPVPELKPSKCKDSCLAALFPVLSPDDACMFCSPTTVHPKGVELNNLVKACSDKEFGGVVVS